jgi:hypothetical protein
MRWEVESRKDDTMHSMLQLKGVNKDRDEVERCFLEKKDGLPSISSVFDRCMF